MEGTNAVDKQITNADKGFMYDNTSNFTIGADDHFFIWIFGATPGLNDSRDNHGIHASIGDDVSNFVKFHVDGNDTLPLGGGKVYAIRFVETALSNLRTLVGTPGTTPSFIGGGLNTTATVKGVNLGVDGARIGNGYDILNGTGADPEADFAGIASDDEGTSEGIFQTAPGGFALQGKLRIGSAGTACEFLDSNVLILILDTIHSLADFTEILIENSASILTLTRVTFLALGTNNLGRFEVLTSTATVVLTSCVFQDFGVTILGTGSTFLSCSWIGSGIITANGADLTGCEIVGFEGTADTSPLIWDVATDPDGLLDDMNFTKGTAATHGIEFGLNSPLTMTVRGMTTSGYHADNGNNDSFFHVLRTSGTVTINVIGGTGNFSYKSAGAIVVVQASVGVSVTAKDGPANVESARVYIKADTGGPLPIDLSTTITRSGSTATATATAHGLTAGQKVDIVGAAQQEYNGVRTILTVPTANTFTYTVSGTPTTPATGTIVHTGVILEGLTNASGQAENTGWPFSSSQPVTGWVRKGSASPLFKQADLLGTVTSAGLDLTAPLVSDE